METSDIIKDLCKKGGITIAELEKNLGFSNGSIAKGNTIRSDRLLSVAKYFHVSMEYLMGEKDYASQYYFSDETAAMAQELYENPDTRMLFDAARNSRPEDLRMAADMLARFKETNPEG